MNHSMRCINLILRRTLVKQQPKVRVTIDANGQVRRETLVENPIQVKQPSLIKRILCTLSGRPTSEEQG